MQLVYDEPEFVVRNLWRLYRGWWDKNPATLKPAPEAAFAAEVVGLAGGVDALIARAQQLATAEIYQARRDQEHSLMSKGIFASAARDSAALAAE